MTGEALVDMAVTEWQSDIQTTCDITEVRVDILSQWMQTRVLFTSVCLKWYEFSEQALNVS